MYFQIAVSPPNQTTKKPQSVAPLEDVAVLKLAPFTPNPKIFFENVTVGDVDVKKLIIQNPSGAKNKLTITKIPPADRFVTLSWNEVEVEPHEEVLLEVTWAPKEDGSWRDVITVRDGKNVDRNVAIIFKSTPKKGKKRVVPKQAIKTKPTVVAMPAVKKFRSPKNTKKKRSPFKISPLKEKMCMPISYKCENCDNNIHITTCSPLKKKNKNLLESNKENSPSILFQQKLENLSPIYQQKVDNLSLSKLSFSEKINRMNNSTFFSSPTNINFKCENILQTPRRETYLKNSPEDLDDSLELEKKLDKIGLTPEIKSAESFIKKLNLDMSPDISILNNTKTKTDNYLVNKLLSDSFQFSTSAITKKTSNLKFLLNDTTVDECFYPNNCSTETKIHEKISRNNSSTPKELFKGNNTYEISPSKNSPNISGDTYSIRSNISSSSTYGILSPEEIHGRVKKLEKESLKISTSSPLQQPTNQPNQFSSNFLNFSGINVKNALSCITEEEQPSEISLKNISLYSNFSNPGSKRKPDPPEMVFTVSPPKRAFIKPKSPKPKAVNTTWSKKFEKTEKIRRKSISTMKLNLSKVSSKSNTSNISTCSSVNITQTSCSIDPFLIAAMYDSNTSQINTHLDPFISSTLYYDETWLDRQMQELKKWLNAILTPPSELAAAAESKKVDVAKLWQDCVKKDLIYAPTKEKVSSKYHTNHKLEILRKSAKNLFHGLEMRTVLSKVTFSIENKHLTMREDKNLHLDVGLQSHILTLLLCYNPLWLRIGLETIYNEPIPLDSNSDVIGLSTFIMLRFFRCPELMPKNKQQVSHIKYLPSYATAIKKFTLKKFLMLVYFLDQAKNKKLISHDPCLFCRDAPVKESKELLLSFSREVLSAVGDITKFLRRFGYEVSHKQSYIDEFDYAVKNLGVDLRDGIRLTKVMEIILLRNDLTNQLRGPAISRLQKVHNVKLALDSLNSAGYTIAGDITAKDIVDGNREKTLSLLWQIIYKFQAPRFTTAATKIQIWWKSLGIVIKRRILDRPRQLKNNSAIKIQQFYRSYKLMQKQRSEFLNIKKSAVTIQRFVRSSFLLKRDRIQYLITRQAIIIIQQKYCAQKLMRVERKSYLELKKAAIFVQRQYRAKLMMKQTRSQYLHLKETAIKIQRIFRSKQIMKQQRENFIEQRNAAVTIQKHFKATLLMKQQRKTYLITRQTVIKLQQRFRATILMRQTRYNYLQQRNSAILIQQKYRATVLMKQTRKTFLQQKQAAVTIQQRYRANIAMKQARKDYLEQRNAALVIQNRFRAYLAMKNNRESYLKLREATVCIQQRFRANLAMKQARKIYLHQRKSAIIIQQQFKAYLQMKSCQENYLKLKQATLCIQQRFRANQAMKIDRQNYLEKRKSAIIIQQQFRAYLQMKSCKENYLKLKQATVCIQQRFRANLAMKQARKTYVDQRKSAIIIQQQFRAYLQMKSCKKSYLKLKQATMCLQQRFRANLALKKARKTYLDQRKSAIIIQQHFRAYLQMKSCKESYLKLKQATVCIQQRFRANLAMKETRKKYLDQRKSAIIIQQQFRAYLQMKSCKESYLKLKQATICIQQRFRANLATKQARKTYLDQRKSAIIIQQQFRAYLQMKSCKESYSKLKQATVCIQQRFRANLAMKIARQNYLEQRKSAIIIQQRFRAYLQMKSCKENYLKLKRSILAIQQRFRANVAMNQVRNNYLIQRKSIITIQTIFKAYLQMKSCRENYLKLRQSTIFIQQQFRANLAMKTARKNYMEKLQAIKVIQQQIKAYLAMKKQREEYLNLRNTTIYVQQQFRANVEMKLRRQEYINLKQSTVLIQQRFRATRDMKIARHEYIQQRNAALFIQQKFRANLEMKNCRENYLKLREAVLNVQERFRANQLMKQIRTEYLEQRKSVLIIQERFRANRTMKIARQQYLSLKQAAICVQDRFRANLEMKKERNNYLQKRNSVITIQKHFRSYVQTKQCRENYLRLKQAVLVLQQRFRATRVMKIVREDFNKQRNAAILIQQQFRAYINMKKCQEEYLSLRLAVLTVQRRFRANLAMKNDRDIYLHQRKAAVFIQRNYRQYRSAKNCRESYLKLKQAVTTIQMRFRANRLMKCTRENYLRQRNAAVLIQQKYRAYLQMKDCQKEFKQQIQSVKIIQNKFRAYIEMKKCRQQYLEIRKSTLIIQQRFREFLFMKQQRTTYLEIKTSTITIQKYFRSYLEMKKCRQEFLEKKGAAIKIQRYFRAYRKKCTIIKQQIKIKSVIRIQCWVRRYVAKKKLEVLRENSKDTEEMRERRRLNKAATKIQALWRGYKTRKAMSKKMVLIHQRSVEANTNAAPELAVGRRNREAIDLLMYQTSMKEIIRALTILDFTTRLFPNLCVEVCDEITERLYILLCFTNRSVPDMDASILCVSVLINLYKFSPTSKAVWKTQYLERILSLLMHWSDKDGLLFPYVCTLIWLFAQNKKYCEELKSQENVDKILKKSYQQCERRQKMLGKMRNAPVAPAKGQKDVLPFLKPDWGIINVNKPRVFKNPVFAIKCLLRKLNL